MHDYTSFVLMLICFFFPAFRNATRFSQDKYASVKAKKNEPLSSIGQKKPRVVVEKGIVEVASFVLIIRKPKAASSIVSLEELTSCPKTHLKDDKGKDKVGACVWEDAATALGRAHNIITTDELKDLSQVPSHELVNCHIHKLVQVLGFFFFFLKLKKA